MSAKSDYCAECGYFADGSPRKRDGAPLCIGCSSCEPSQLRPPVRSQDEITERYPARSINPAVAAETLHAIETSAKRRARDKRNWFLANPNQLLATLIWSVPEEHWQTVLSSTVGAS